MRNCELGLQIMEEEVRKIISQVVSVPDIKLSLVFSKYFGEQNGVDLVLEKHIPHLPTLPSHNK